MWAFRGALAVTLLAGVVVAADAQVRDSDFFGTWVSVEGSDRGCVISGEGDHFVLGRNYYEPGDGAACKEAKVWLHDKKLRVSATCEGEEYGFRATTREFTLLNANELSTVSLFFKMRDRFALCVMPSHHLRLSHIQSVVSADIEIGESVAEILMKGKPDNREIDISKASNEILKKFGYVSIDQFNGIKYIITDILRFIDEPEYLARRHMRGNVELVTAHKATLSKLTEESLEKVQ